MNLISEITRGVFLLNPDIAQRYFPLVHNILTGNIVEANMPVDDPQENYTLVSLTDQGTIATQSANSLFNDEERTNDNTIFCCDVIGPITKYDGLCQMGVKTRLDYLKQADQTQGVIAHILRIDSGGGEANASQLFADGISKLSKPVFAYVEGMAASAAYWIASACSLICASSEMDRVGSIGSYITIADYSEWYASQGINVTEVYAKKSTEKNQDYLSAISGDTTRLQGLVDQYNEFFLAAVLENRYDQLDPDADWNTGKMFFSKQAMQHGLIDLVADFDSFSKHIIKELSKQTLKS